MYACKTIAHEFRGVPFKVNRLSFSTSLRPENLDYEEDIRSDPQCFYDLYRRRSAAKIEVLVHVASLLTSEDIAQLARNYPDHLLLEGILEIQLGTCPLFEWNFLGNRIYNDHLVNNDFAHEALFLASKYPESHRLAYIVLRNISSLGSQEAWEELLQWDPRIWSLPNRTEIRRGEEWLSDPKRLEGGKRLQSRYEEENWTGQSLGEQPLFRYSHLHRFPRQFIKGTAT